MANCDEKGFCERESVITRKNHILFYQLETKCHYFIFVEIIKVIIITQYMYIPPTS